MKAKFSENLNPELFGGNKFALHCLKYALTNLKHRTVKISNVYMHRTDL